MSWAAEEMKKINLGDKRLNERLLFLFDKLGNSPNLSIPASCGGWHETKAAYRFFDHERVTAENILAPHIESTIARMHQHSVVFYCKLQLAEKHRFDPCLVLYMIIAWRILYLTVLSRECPEVNCELIFSTEEWKIAHIILKKEPPPEEPPPLNIMVKMVASMGGYLNRKSDPEPGPTTLWIGFQRLKDFLLAQQALRDITYG